MNNIIHSFPNVSYIIDANQAWNFDYAQEFISSLYDGNNVLCIEQPCNKDDILTLADIASISKYTIMADESVFNLHDARLVNSIGAANMINIKLAKSAGLAGSSKIINFAKSNNIQVFIGCMIESEVAIVSALHLANAYGINIVDLDPAFMYKDYYPSCFNIDKNIMMLNDNLLGSGIDIGKYMQYVDTF